MQIGTGLLGAKVTQKSAQIGTGLLGAKRDTKSVQIGTGLFRPIPKNAQTERVTFDFGIGLKPIPRYRKTFRLWDRFWIDSKDRAELSA